MELATDLVASLTATIEAGGQVDFAEHDKKQPEVVAAYREVARRFVATADPFPSHRFHGRGIVICGGGDRYFPCAWVAIRMLRHLGCTLPIQLWHLGAHELDDRMATMIRALGVDPVDAEVVRRQYPSRILNGWEVKCFAILHAPFREVLLLDSDNVPLIDPTALFDRPEYRATGAAFWPDFCRHEPWRPGWTVFDVPYQDEPEFESGQILVDKRICWDALRLTMHYNEHSDYYYEHIWGDKETFHFAFRRLDAPYAMPERGIHALDGCMCQHDFDGSRIFQHRNMDKWRLSGTNRRIFGFEREELCRQFLRELRTLWRDSPYQPPEPTPRVVELTHALTGQEFLVEFPTVAPHTLILGPDGRVEGGTDSFERTWSVQEIDGALTLSILGSAGVACLLTRVADTWVGPWLAPA